MKVEDDPNVRRLAALINKLRWQAGTVDPRTGEVAPVSFKELAVRTGWREGGQSDPDALSSQMVNFVARGKRRLVDPRKFSALARALGNTTAAELMEAAGLTSSTPPPNRLISSITARLHNLPEEAQQEIADFVAFTEQRFTQGRAPDGPKRRTRRKRSG